MAKQVTIPKVAKGQARKASVARKASSGKSLAKPRYLALIKGFPLRPLRSTQDLDDAIRVLDKLHSLSRQLHPEEQDYLECLSHEIERYEAENVPMPAVSGADALRHLIEARHAKLTDVAAATGVAVSTLSSVLNGNRKLNLDHIKRLTPYFGVEPAVFLD